MAGLDNNGWFRQWWLFWTITAVLDNNCCFRHWVPTSAGFNKSNFLIRRWEFHILDLTELVLLREKLGNSPPNENLPSSCWGRNWNNWIDQLICIIYLGNGVICIFPEWVNSQTPQWKAVKRISNLLFQNLFQAKTKRFNFQENVFWCFKPPFFLKLFFFF